MGEPIEKADPQRAIDVGLAARLSRPLVRPGVLTVEPGARIIARVQRMSAGLPLLAALTRHLPADAAAGRPPIVYGRRAEVAAPDQGELPPAVSPRQGVPVVSGRQMAAAPSAPVLVQRTPVVYGRQIVVETQSSLPAQQPLVLRQSGPEPGPATPGAEDARRSAPAHHEPPGQASAERLPAVRVVLPAGRRVQRSGAGAVAPAPMVPPPEPGVQPRGAAAPAEGVATAGPAAWHEPSGQAPVMPAAGDVPALRRRLHPGATAAEPALATAVQRDAVVQAGGQTAGARPVVRATEMLAASADSIAARSAVPVVRGSQPASPRIQPALWAGGARPVVWAAAMPAASADGIAVRNVATAGRGSQPVPPRIQPALWADGAAAPGDRSLLQVQSSQAGGQAGGLAAVGAPPGLQRTADEPAGPPVAPPTAPQRPPEIDVAAVSEQVYSMLVRRLADERERRGW